MELVRKTDEPAVEQTPAVSVILPTLNERGFVRDCLDSLAQQDYRNVVEVLVIDGGSTDGTRDVVATFGDKVRLIENPRVTAAAALNVGLDAAVGEVIVRADAHTIYESAYVRESVETLLRTDAWNVGGAMRPVGTTSFGRAVAAVTSSPAGIGPGKFHYSDEEQDVDTVYLGCWRRETLRRLDGWDEANLQWGAEDQDLNFRIRAAGGKVRLNPTIRSWYFPRETPRALWRQYFNYGVCKASALAKHRTLPTWRPLAPAALVAGSAITAGVARGRWRVLVIAGHASLAAVFAARLSRDPGVAPHRVFAAMSICHWSYGLGFWSGIFRWMTGQGFDSRPRGHR